jgi:hypothetical protein
MGLELVWEDTVHRRLLCIFAAFSDSFGQHYHSLSSYELNDMLQLGGAKI